MGKRLHGILATMAVGLATILMAGCGGAGGGALATTPAMAQTPGSLVTFATDAPICDVQSFVVTMTSAGLVPSGGGTAVPIISSTPATVDFGRLTDFTTILGTASVTPGTYNQLQMTLTNPQLTALNTATVPPSPLPVTATFSNNSTTESLTVNISPALVITSGTTSGITMDFNLRKSLSVDGNGQVTGTVDPQFILTPATVSGTIVGEADSVYGIVQTVTPSSTDPATGSFTLQVHDGMGQILTVQVDDSTELFGDGVTSLGLLMPGTFVEVDAIVDTSGNIIAQEVDSEEQISVASQRSSFLGRILAVTRDGSNNATQFTLLVDDEIPDLSGEIPLHSGLTVNLTSLNTTYFTNWRTWNPGAFTFSPQTLGVAQNVAVHGVLGSGSPPSLTAHQVFLRPRSVMGNFTSLLAAQSDDKTGGFTMVPCGALFQAKPITVLTFPHSVFNGLSGLTALTPGPTVNTRGLLLYQQTNGSLNGANWTAPTWVMEARGVHQLPN